MRPPTLLACNLCLLQLSCRRVNKHGEMVIHLLDGVIAEEFARYIDIDNDVAISANNTDAEICHQIQAVAAESGELDDYTAVDSSEVQADISTASFSDTVHSLHNAACVSGGQRLSGLQLIVGVCIRAGGVGLNGAQQVCTLRLNTHFILAAGRALNWIRLYTHSDNSSVPMSTHVLAHTKLANYHSIHAVHRKSE